MWNVSRTTLYLFFIGFSAETLQDFRTFLPGLQIVFLLKFFALIAFIASLRARNKTSVSNCLKRSCKSWLILQIFFWLNRLGCCCHAYKTFSCAFTINLVHVDGKSSGANTMRFAAVSSVSLGLDVIGAWRTFQKAFRIVCFGMRCCQSQAAIITRKQWQEFSASFQFWLWLLPGPD